MARSIITSLGLIIAIAGLTGCRTGGGGSGNTNSNDNASTNGLTESQAAAVESAVRDLAAFATTLAGAAVVSDPPDGDGTFGECPVVTGEATDEIVTITLDYGDGCTAEAYGGATLSGVIEGSVNRITRAVSLLYLESSIDDQSVDGSITFDRTSDPTDGDSFNLDVLLAVSGLGTLDGSLTVGYDPDTSIITLNEGSFVLTEEGDAIEIVALDLVYDPVGNGNFIPEAGRLTLTVPNDDPPPDSLIIVVTFDEQSPQDGTVDVKVGNAPTVEYELENLP